ncbi:RNA-binding protein [Desulfosarcina variabilis str. Montpellier]|uniref:YhbY family RNA-binding protein n=1 Tax=Desulfosarcina variabilis TaxID=2300 RepID=UPI003AFAD801
MGQLTGFQKRFLRSLAHPLKPVVFVGQKGITAAFTEAMNDALDQHELVKVKFIDFKEKIKKLALTQHIEKDASCEMVGIIGHVATFYRRQSDAKKRKINLPQPNKK